jgi:hypothetical protein
MVCRYIGVAACILSGMLIPFLGAAQTNLSASPGNAKQQAADKKAAAKQNAGKPPTPAEELQTEIADAGNDRAALVKNLQTYLEKYPDAPQRPQIYRALVEACTQFHDDVCATNYAERIVSLTPEDVSMTLLAIQLLERTGDTLGCVVL